MDANRRPTRQLIQSFQLINGLSAESIDWLIQELEPISLEAGTALPKRI